MAITQEQKERLLALPVEQKIKMLETLRKLHPREKLPTEPVEKPVCNVSESAVDTGLESD